MSVKSSDSTASQLSLTPFEEYMLCDDRPDYPMTGFFRLRFSERLVFRELESAIQSAVARHPLLRSKVSNSGQPHHHWVTERADSVRLEQWSANEGNEFPPASHIDLTRSIGLRTWLVDRMGAHDLVVQAHHACTDALGLCQLIEDILLAYAANVGVPVRDAEFRLVDNARLPDRNGFGLTWRKVLGMLPGLTFGLHVIVKFFLRKAAPLAPRFSRQGVAQGPETFPSALTFEFDSADTSRIKSEARERNVTVNEILARDLFLALQVWRTRYGIVEIHRWLRFFVPVNQRTAADGTRSAANIMSAVFLDRHPRQMTDPEELLQSIHAEMQIVKRWQLGFLFIAAMSALNRFRRIRHHILRRDECASTCVFSNIGIILREIPLPRQGGRIAIEELVLEGVDFIAPVRPQTTAAFCVYTYAGRLSVNLHFDPRAISQKQADDLLETFVVQIRDSLQDCTGDAATPGTASALQHS